MRTKEGARRKREGEEELLGEKIRKRSGGRSNGSTRRRLEDKHGEKIREIPWNTLARDVGLTSGPASSVLRLEASKRMVK